MKSLFLFTAVLLMQIPVHAQALRDINFNYLYSPEQPFKFKTKAVRTANAWSLYFKLQLADTTSLASSYRLQWDVRSALYEKSGTKIKQDSTVLEGVVEVPTSAAVQIVVVKVVHVAAKQAWYFYQILDPKYPVNAVLKSKSGVVLDRYVKGDQSYSLTNESLKTVSYYKKVFPPASLVFSETLGKVSSGIPVDSTFTLPENAVLDSLKEGLYLVQKDTNATEGIAFRVQPDYPRYAKVENLADPFIYVCTKAEFDRMKAAKGDKKAFDRVILSVTNDTERAKRFMRSYFRRVELANQYFSSYKEGWKTDRGMIYIIFGLPDEVFRFNDREVWNYKDDLFKVSFDFVKSPTLFDPDNYVVIREKKYEQTWYEVIDLWRSARF